MKLHLPANNCRTLAFSLVAIVGLSSAFVPGQALARKHKAKAVAAPAAVKAKASPWAGTSTSTDAEKPAKPAGRVSVASGKGKGKGRPGHLTRAEQHDANKICVDSFNTAKERRESGHLIEAREFLSKCARPSCSDFLRQECTTLYTQLEVDVPTVVPVVNDDTGAPHALAEVRMDGELLTSKIDGHALQVDPGKHEFSFATEAGVFATLKAMIVQGQRNRPITALLHSKNKAGGSTDQTAVAAATASKAEAPVANSVAEETGAEGAALAAVDSEEVASSAAVRRPTTLVARSEGETPWLAYTLGGVGALSLGSAGLFTLWGRKDNSTLMTSCSPYCNTASVHHIRNLYLAADISIGVVSWL